MDKLLVNKTSLFVKIMTWRQKDRAPKRIGAKIPCRQNIRCQNVGAKMFGAKNTVPGRTGAMYKISKGLCTRGMLEVEDTNV